MSTNSAATNETTTQNDANQATKRQRVNSAQEINSNPTTPFVSPTGSRTNLNETKQVVLTDNCLIYYRTLRKIQKGLLKATHHLTIMNQHCERGTTPRGIQANITTQLPDISPTFQLEWERAHLDFASTLTRLLSTYWLERKVQLTETETKTKLLNDIAKTCKTEELTEITDLLDKVTINPENTQRAERKVAAASRSRTFLQVPKSTPSSTSVRRR